MRQDGFEYEIKAVMFFDAADAKLLNKLSRQHYSGECIDLSKPDGFLTGVLHQGENVSWPVRRAMTFREIDILNKTLEVGQYARLPPDELGVASALLMALGRALAAINNRVSEIRVAPTRVTIGTVKLAANGDIIEDEKP